MKKTKENDMAILKKPLFSNPSLTTAVIVTRTSWEEAPRVRHQVTRQLLRFFNVIYIQKNYRNKDDKIVKLSDRHVIYTPCISKHFFIRLYANLPAYHYFFNERFACKIDKFLRALKTGKKILINFEFDFYQIMRRNYYAYKIYYCYDEFPKMRRTNACVNRYKKKYQAWLYQIYENAVAKCADKCLVSHEPLKRKLKRVNSNTELFLHGHEFKSFYCKKSKKKTDLIKVGFMGYITYNVLVDWLLKIVKTQDMSLYLIGPMEKFEISRFHSYANFKHIPSLTGEKLFETLLEMNVLIIPYNHKLPQYEIQTASNKFFQYLATGSPIVISNMKYYLKMPQGVFYRANNSNEFINQIRRAFNEDCEKYRALRQKYATENTWNKRGDRLIEILKDVS